MKEAATALDTLATIYGACDTSCPIDAPFSKSCEQAHFVCQEANLLRQPKRIENYSYISSAAPLPGSFSSLWKGWIQNKSASAGGTAAFADTN